MSDICRRTHLTAKHLNHNKDAINDYSGDPNNDNYIQHDANLWHMTYGGDVGNHLFHLAILHPLPRQSPRLHGGPFQCRKSCTHTQSCSRQQPGKCDESTWKHLFLFRVNQPEKIITSNSKQTSIWGVFHKTVLLKGINDSIYIHCSASTDHRSVDLLANSLVVHHPGPSPGKTASRLNL
jgi:hypothetical protein